MPGAHKTAAVAAALAWLAGAAAAQIDERAVVTNEARNACANVSRTVTPATQAQGCSEIITIGRDSPADIGSAHINRAIARRSLGDSEGAIADYGEAIRLRPGDPAPFYNRAIARTLMRDYPGAIADYGEAIALNPRHPAAYNNRGAVHAAQGDFARAIADYDRAIELNNRFANALVNRGIAHLRSDDAAQALRDFDAALQVEPADANALYGRGLAKQRSGQDGGADLAAASAQDANVGARFAAQGLTP